LFWGSPIAFENGMTVRLYHIILVLFVSLALTACDQSSTSPQGPGQIKPKIERPTQKALMLIEKAKSGDLDAQFDLGIMYYLGEEVVRDYVEAYIWFSLSAFQGHEAASIAAMDVAYILSDLNILTEARLKGNIYHYHYLQQQKTENPPDEFTLEINDTRYQFVSAITPDIPIFVKATHSNPNITKIRLQNRNDPSKKIDFAAGQRVNIKNTDNQMKKGVTSSIEFLALDDSERVKGNVIITFVPETE
jgi:hypothetical protein